jgi:hypothetical protein
MDNANNRSNLSFCLIVRPPQATVDLRLELGNKRFLGHEAAWGKASFFEISNNLYSLSSTDGARWQVVV